MCVWIREWGYGGHDPATCSTFNSLRTMGDVMEPTSRVFFSFLVTRYGLSGAEFIVSELNTLKMNTGGHTVHKLIDHGCHPYTDLYGEQEETDPHMGVAIIM